MVSVNSINSQINFSGSKKTEKANGQKQKPKLNELGNRTFEQKYSKDGKPVNMTTANAGILLGDYVLDHLIEFAVAGVTFVGVALKGKKILNGVTGSLVDATKQMADKKGDKIGATKKFAQYIENTKKNIKLVRTAKANNIADNTQSIVKENAKKSVLQGSLVDKLAQKADDDSSLFSKFVKKVLKNPNAGSDDVRNFFAKKLGITRGADIVDSAATIGIAGVASKAAKDGTDIGTDLNDESVANKADAANHHSIEKAKKAADIVLKAL